MLLNSTGQARWTTGNSGIAKQILNGNRNMVPKLVTMNLREMTAYIPERLLAIRNRKGDEVLKDSRATSSSRIHQPGLHG